jgi:hypothetical protein
MPRRSQTRTSEGANTGMQSTHLLRLPRPVAGVIAASLLLTWACSASSPAPSGSGGSGGSGGSSAGSGGTIIPGSGGSGGSGGTAGTGVIKPPDPVDTAGAGGENCGLVHFDLERRAPQVLLLLDRSASMQDPPDGASDGVTKWEHIQPAVLDIIAATSTTVSWAFKVFPEGEGSECVEGSVTDDVPVEFADSDDVLALQAKADEVRAAVMATTDEGNGTPTGDAVAASAAYLSTLTSTNRKFILLATDGEPSCAGTTEGQEEARPYATNAVTTAQGQGFDTFVVGVATTKESATIALNDMAMAGGQPVPNTNPLATKFYLGNNQAELAAALNAITVVVADCQFPLTAPPPDPLNVGVSVSADKVPPDLQSQNGWNYTDNTNTVIEVYGEWCEQIKASGANRVNIVYGCPDINVR